MTIQRRLSLSFLIILMLFAVNLVIYFWGNQRRLSTVEGLRSALSRQALIAVLNQNLNNIQKQITLLSQVATESSASTGADPTDVAEFNKQLKKVEQDINELHSLSEPDTKANIAAFAEAYQQLSTSWRVFYENFGVDQAKAITELVVRAEPLAQEVIQQRLPQLQQGEMSASRQPAPTSTTLHA